MLNALLFSAGQLQSPPQVPLLPTLGELQKRAEATANAQAASDPVPEYKHRASNPPPYVQDGSVVAVEPGKLRKMAPESVRLDEPQMIEGYERREAEKRESPCREFDEREAQSCRKADDTGGAAT